MANTKYFKWASWAMITTGFIHLIGHFAPPDLDTPDKQKLYELMRDLQFQFDPWFSRSVMDLFDVFSLFLTVMLLTIGLNNLIVSRQNLESSSVKTLSMINFIGMMAMLILSFVYAFSVPIVLFAICANLMLVSYLKA